MPDVVFCFLATLTESFYITLVNAKAMGRGIHCRVPSLFLRQHTDVDEGRVAFVTECQYVSQRFEDLFSVAEIA